MAKKEECVAGARFVVNEKKSKWSTNMGVDAQHLFAYPYGDTSGVFVSDIVSGNGQISLPNGSVLEVVNKPRRRQNINELQFKVISVPNCKTVPDDVLSTYYVCFAKKADLLTVAVN